MFHNDVDFWLDAVSGLVTLRHMYSAAALFIIIIFIMMGNIVTDYEDVQLIYKFVEGIVSLN